MRTMTAMRENGKAVPGYRDLIDELSGEFPLGQPIIGEQKQKGFHQALRQYPAAQKYLKRI